MSLGLRIHLLIVSVRLVLLATAGALIVDHARRSVAEEMDSAMRLTLNLLATASAGTIAPVDPGSATPQVLAARAHQTTLRAALVRRLSQLGDVRHVDVALVPDDGFPPFAPTPQAREAGGPPAWFSKAVSPERVEKRLQLGVPGRRVEIALRPNPADEIAEAWQESLSTFALLVAFALLMAVFTSVTLHHALKPIERIVTALARLEAGDYAGARLAHVRLPELRRISTRFNRMVAAMARQQAENQALRRQSLAIQEGERRLLARELHDELGQSISAIKALAVSTRQNPEAGERVRQNTLHITEICDHIYAVVRRLMSELRPATLDTLGLQASLDKLVGDWRRHHAASARLDLTVDADLDALDEDTAIKLYRIVQEGLTNVTRHANASHVEVHLGQDGRGKLVLEVSDDGRGFDPASARQGLGLLGIRERVSSLDGELHLDTAPGGGTRLCAVIPVAVGRSRDDAPLADPANSQARRSA